MTDYEIEMEFDEALEEFPEDKQPVNLSYWNSGSEYKNRLSKILKYETEQDLFDYEYWFPKDARKLIAKKLGFSDKDHDNLLYAPISQSTLSIVTLAVFLSKQKAKLGIVAPVYFTVETCCTDLKVPYTLFEDFMENINETFDVELLLCSDCDAFWFTSPVNSCSIYYNKRVTDGIQKLLDAGKLVIIDESLCVNGMELSRTFGAQENLLYIYSPHKTLGIQGIKFSEIVVHNKYYDDIDSLEDCYGGSLNYSCQQGSVHFASGNFDECVSFYNTFWKENLKVVKDVLGRYDFAQISPEVNGHYAMIFIDFRIDDKQFVDAMKALMKSQGYFVYPGVMQGFYSSKRFCFRINMLLNKEDLEKGLTAVLNWMQSVKG